MFVWFGSPWSLTGSGLSDTTVFELIAPLPFSLLEPYGLPDLSATPVSLVPHVSHLFSLAVKAFGCGVSRRFGFVWFGLGCVFACLVLFFCCLCIFASLLAFSLTAFPREKKIGTHKVATVCNESASSISTSETRRYLEARRAVPEAGDC